MDQAEDYALRDRHGARFAMRLRRHRRLNRCFEKFETTLETKAALHRGSLAGAPFMLCALDALIDEVSAALAIDADATLAPDGVATRLSPPRVG
jgi:hypothetical protein